MKIRTLICCLLVASVTAIADDFEPAYTMDEVLEHQKKVPLDSHWWAVTGPQMGWMHKNTQQMFPSVPVYRHGQVRELRSRPMAEIADFPIQTPTGEMRFEDMLSDDQSTAMGVVILHKGDVVFESYPRMKDYEKVIYWSVAKVFAGTIVHLLEQRGQVDSNDPIETYIPDLAESSFAGTTVRSFLDHASGLDCDENYEDPESCYYEYSMAIGDNVRNEKAVDNPYDYFINADVARLREPGKAFRYSGANNFILAWLVTEVTGYPFQDIVTQEFWQHIGAESDAGFFAYRYGIAVSHGGFQARMRDLARFGLLFTPSYGVVSERRIIGDDFLELLFNGANPNLVWTTSGGTITQVAYQWSVEPERRIISHGGWGGQGLIIDTHNDVVALFVSYTKDDNSQINLEAAVREVISTVLSEVPESGD